MIPIHYTPCSTNEKIGPIPATVLGRQGCVQACAFYGNGCYAEAGPLSWHWKRVSSGERDMGLQEVCSRISALSSKQIWRHAVAGDITDGSDILPDLLTALTQANAHRPVIAYTHADPEHGDNARLLAHAAQGGFRINLSANSPEHADKLADLGLASVVTAMPKDAPRKARTPAGRAIATCPATYREDVTCASCGLCARHDREVIVGFPAHGTSWKKVDFVARRQA